MEPGLISPLIEKEWEDRIFILSVAKESANIPLTMIKGKILNAEN
jgi:hypothetical protein